MRDICSGPVYLELLLDYEHEVNRTPTFRIPPAALLFLTALGGVGWLGRRKAKRLTPA